MRDKGPAKPPSQPTPGSGPDPFSTYFLPAHSLLSTFLSRQLNLVFPHFSSRVNHPLQFNGRVYRAFRFPTTNFTSMLLKPLVAAAGLAVAAQAFLLPPEVSELDVDIVQVLDDIAKAAPVVILDCPGCPVQFRNRDGRIRTKTNKPNQLALLFKIDQGADSDSLVLNGFELYPKSDPIHHDLIAPQILQKHPHKKHDGKWKEKHHRGPHKGPHHRQLVTPQLGYTLQALEVLGETESQQTTVVLDFQIIEVGPQFVHGIPNVLVTLTKDNQGRLTIHDIKVGPSENAGATNPLDKSKECDNFVCKWMAFVEEKLGKPFNNCANKFKHGARPTENGELHHHRPHHFRHRQRTWAQLLKSIASHILVPVAIGIAAGISASL